MLYFFVVGLTTCYGPWNIAVKVESEREIGKAIDDAARAAGLKTCHEWQKIEPITHDEWFELVTGVLTT